jgi:hypothetical protein
LVGVSAPPQAHMRPASETTVNDEAILLALFTASYLLFSVEWCAAKLHETSRGRKVVARGPSDGYYLPARDAGYRLSITDFAAHAARFAATLGARRRRAYD